MKSKEAHFNAKKKAIRFEIISFFFIVLLEFSFSIGSCAESQERLLNQERTYTHIDIAVDVDM